MNYTIKIGILKKERTKGKISNIPYYYYFLCNKIQANDFIGAYLQAKDFIKNNNLEPGKYRLHIEETNFNSVKLFENFKVQ